MDRTEDGAYQDVIRDWQKLCADKDARAEQWKARAEKVERSHIRLALLFGASLGLAVGCVGWAYAATMTNQDLAQRTDTVQAQAGAAQQKAARCEERLASERAEAWTRGYGECEDLRRSCSQTLSECNAFVDWVRARYLRGGAK